MNKYIQIVLIVVCFGCNNSNNDIEKLANSREKLNISSIGIDTLDIVNTQIKRYSIIYYFDSDCPACVAPFIEWIKKLESSKWNNNFQLYFVSITPNLDFTKYCLEQTETKISSNYRFIVDSTQLLVQKNSFLEYDFNIILIDSNNVILSLDNPFNDEYSYKIYKNAQIIH